MASRPAHFCQHPQAQLDCLMDPPCQLWTTRQRHHLCHRNQRGALCISNTSLCLSLALFTSPLPTRNLSPAQLPCIVLQGIGGGTSTSSLFFSFFLFSHFEPPSATPTTTRAMQATTTVTTTTASVSAANATTTTTTTHP